MHNYCIADGWRERRFTVYADGVMSGVEELSKKKETSMRSPQEEYTFHTDTYERKGKWIRYRADGNLIEVRREVNLSSCEATGRDVAELNPDCVLRALKRTAEGLIDPGVTLESHSGRPIRLTVIGWRVMTQEEVSDRDSYKRRLEENNRSASDGHELRQRARLRELLEKFPDEIKEGGA